MDAKLATRLLVGIGALWLVAASFIVAFAVDGMPLLSPTINMILFAGLSTVTVVLLVIRSHVGLAGRLNRLQVDVDSMSERLDHRDAALYRDFIRRLDAMQRWMMRPAIPRGAAAVRGSAVLTAVPLDEPTQPMPVVEIQPVEHRIDRDVIDMAARAAKRLRDGES